MIKAVVFDMGGVILDLDRDKCVNAFKALGMDCIDEMLDKYHQRGFFRMMEAGEIGEEEFCRLCISASRPGTTADDVRNALISFAHSVQPYKLEFIKELSAKYDLYVLSNNNPIVVRDFDAMCEPYGVTFAKTFKKCFFSYQLKTLKPDPEFFRTVLREIALPGDELLFVDDSQANVDAAREQGMNAVYYDISTDLRDCVLGALK